MSITLWTAASRRIGIGHLRRTEALAKALIAAGAQPRLVFQGEPRLAQLLQSSGLQAVCVSDTGQALEVVAQQPGLVVSDLPGLCAEHSRYLRELGCGPLVHLTDADGLRYEADLFLDGDALDKPHLARRLGGAEYNILRPQVLARRPVSPRGGHAVRRILVCLGGADPGRCTERLLADWCGAAHLGLVAGPAVSLARRRAWRRCLRHGDRLFEAPADLPGLILRHDLVVTLGGITSYEAMCLGVPVAAVAWKHMRPYVRGMAAAGLLHDLGPAQDAAASLRALIRRPAALAHRCRRAYLRVDGFGAQRCAQVILGLMACADGSSFLEQGTML